MAIMSRPYNREAGEMHDRIFRAWKPKKLDSGPFKAADPSRTQVKYKSGDEVAYGGAGTLTTFVDGKKTDKFITLNKKKLYTKTK